MNELLSILGPDPIAFKVAGSKKYSQNDFIFIYIHSYVLQYQFVIFLYIIDI